MTATIDDQGLLLNGLDGSNSLAFLAAVGALRTVAYAHPTTNLRMKWVRHNSSWAPVLTGNRTVSAGHLVELLFSALRVESTPEFDFSKNLNVNSELFRGVAVEAQTCASPVDRRYADFVASFGCELVTTHANRGIQDTALRTMSGAGHQHFLGTMKQLVHETTAEHLRRALFEMWDYSDDKLGLRWDPEEDRRYALRWGNPSDDAVKTVRGANRLAVEALPLFPTAPGDRHLETTGFSRQHGAVVFTWPIWEDALSMDVMRSLFSLPEMQRAEPDRAILRAVGVVEVYRSQRITVGKYRNFTRAQPA
ncbi:MAG: hypothetical protein OXC69_02310 [Candidatus Tectomicrobia bacterium]|nr:hypothetical protein [Candidatus Tectomicrobia bacterium]